MLETLANRVGEPLIQALTISRTVESRDSLVGAASQVANLVAILGA